MQIKTSKTEICNPEPNETAILHKTGLKLFIGSTSIKEVTEIRFLGVTFDTKLNWNAHITKVQKKLKIAFASSIHNSSTTQNLKKSCKKWRAPFEIF